jgi:hypothetical protein
MSDGTKAPNMPEAIARTVDKPKSVEPCANAAKASMTSYKASKMAGTKTDPPEVAREVIKKEDVAKTAVRQPKGECDPESNLPCSCSRRRFVEHPDKLPMPATASNRKVLEALIKELLRRVKDNPADKSASDMMYNTATLRSGYPLKDTANVAQQIDADVMLEEEEDQRRRLKAIAEEEDSGDRQDDGVRDDQDQKFTLPTHETTNPVNTTCLRQWDEEEHSLVEDYIGEEGGKERHVSLKTYDIKSSKEREMQPTHHKESSVFDDAYLGDVSKLFDEAYKGNVFKLAVKDTDEEPPKEHDDQDCAANTWQQYWSAYWTAGLVSVSCLDNWTGETGQQDWSVWAACIAGNGTQNRGVRPRHSER